MSLTAPAEVDVVVVGGGPTGLAAASALIDLPDVDVLLLEERDRLGGRMHSAARGDGWLNYGAHVFPGGCTEISRLAAKVDVEMITVPGVKTALWFEGRLHRSQRVETYPFVLPLSVRERFDLVQVGLRLRFGVAAWRRSSSGFRSRRTFRASLGRAAPRVVQIFETAARRSSGEADRLTEGGALALFGALWASSGRSSANIAGGSGRLGEAFASRLGARAVTLARVVAVAEHDDHVLVTYRGREGRQHHVRARHVVLAIPAPGVPEIVTDIPSDVLDDLHSLDYGAFVCLSVLTTSLPPTAWDDVYAIATPGAEFDMLFHHSNPILQRAERRCSARSLMCYVGGDRAKAALDEDDDVIRGRFLDQIYEVLPETRDAVLETKVHKWREGNCYPTPSASVARVERWNRRPGGRVVLAGDYLAPFGGSAEAAVRSGAEAVGLLRNAGVSTVSEEQVGDHA